MARWHQCHSLLFPPIGQPEPILSLSRCYSAEDLTSLYPFLPAVAVVAVHLTPTAIIEQCGEAGVLGGRGFPVGKAAAQVCREVVAECRYGQRHGRPISVGDSKLLEIVVDGLRSGHEERCRVAFRSEGQGTHLPGVDWSVREMPV